MTNNFYCQLDLFIYLWHIASITNKLGKGQKKYDLIFYMNL